MNFYGKLRVSAPQTKWGREYEKQTASSADLLPGHLIVRLRFQDDQETAGRNDL
jgi:hypothetical protein